MLITDVIKKENLPSELPHLALRGRGIALQQGGGHLGSLLQALVAAVAIDDGEDVGGADIHLRAFVVAGGSTYAPFGIAYDGHKLDVERSAANAFKGLLVATNAKAQLLTDNLIGIEATDGVARTQGHEVDEVDERIDTIQVESAQQSAA